jgi:hypothetical protein
MYKTSFISFKIIYEIQHHPTSFLRVCIYGVHPTYNRADENKRYLLLLLQGDGYV